MVHLVFMLELLHLTVDSVLFIFQAKWLEKQLSETNFIIICVTFSFHFYFCFVSRLNHQAVE